MIGEYLREAAVLMLVFIPIDLWKHTEITGARLAEVGAFSLAILALGMFLEWVALLAKRIQRTIEED